MFTSQTLLVVGCYLSAVNNTFKQFFSPHMDFAGFVASMLCAIHCSILPVLLSLGLLSGLGWMESIWVEVGLLTLSFGIASYALYKGYKHHHVSSAFFAVFVGFVFFFIGLQQEGILEILLTTFGGLTIAFAHILNWRLSKNCNKCHH